MNPKFKGALIGLLLLAIAVFTSACELGENDEAAPAVPEITASSSPSSENRAPDKPAATNGVPKDVPVQNNNDELEEVPWVAGESITDGDTRDSSSMPSLHKLLPDCGVLVDWQSLVDCVYKQKNAQWYIEGINQRTDITHGATWNDIVKMAKARTPSGKKPAGVRVIQVYGWSEKEKSKAEARKAVAPLVGEEAASKMEVLYYTVDAFANTWRTKGDKPAMQTFADYNREVRVTLAPLKLNPNGTVAGRIEGVPWGVFVDCYNLHGFFKLVPKKPGSPLLCPPGTPNTGKPMTGVKSCYPPIKPVCKNGKCSPPPCAYKCRPPEECKYPCKPTGKDTWNDPSVLGRNRPGHNGSHPSQQDPIGPPGGGTPPATYTPAPKPPPSTTPRPTPPPPVETSAPQPSTPAPPGDPCEQDPTSPVCD